MSTDPIAAYCSATPNEQRSPTHSPRLPIPGRTFNHLSQNPQDPGLSAEQLHRRSGAADEVADIMEAIKRSLDPQHNAKPSDVEEQASAPALGHDSSSSLGLGSKHPITPNESHVATECANPSQPQPTPRNAMVAMKSIESRLDGLTHEFVFPSEPEFPVESPQVSGRSTPTLLFTPTNQPVRAHEHDLAALLTELDAVESDGDEDIRRVRKGLVSRVESELADLERKKDDAWKRISGTWPAKSEQEAEGYVIAPAPNTHQDEESATSEVVLEADEPSRDSLENGHGPSPRATPLSQPTAPTRPAGDSGDATSSPDARGVDALTTSEAESVTEAVPPASDASTDRVKEGDNVSVIRSADNGDDRSAEFVMV
jgi:hypothetical protein